MTKPFVVLQHNGSEPTVNIKREPILVGEAGKNQKSIQHTRSVVSTHAESPYQMFSYLVNGLPVQVAVELTGGPETYGDAFAKITQFLEDNVVAHVAALSKQELNIADGSKEIAERFQDKVATITAKDSSKIGCNVSMAAVFLNERNEKKCAGFVTGNATLVVKQSADAEDENQLSIYTQADNPYFNVSVASEDTANVDKSGFRKSVMVFLDVPITIIKTVCSDPDDHTVSHLRDTAIQTSTGEKLPTHYAAYAAIVPFEAERAENIGYCKQESSSGIFGFGSGRSEGSSSKGSDRSLVADSENSKSSNMLKWLFTDEDSYRNMALVSGIFSLVWLVLAVGDWADGASLTKVWDDWSQGTWPDGDIGKHALTGFAFAAVAVGAGCMFYYGAKHLWNRGEDQASKPANCSK